MKNSLLKGVVVAALAVLALGVGAAGAATYTVNPATLTLGYVNVFDLGNNYLWGSAWGVADLTATWSGDCVTLGPNSINDPNVYWYDWSSGTPVGQKLMEANLYTQVDDGSLAGQTVTFEGFMQSNTLTPAHVAVAFIKDFAADWSSFAVAAVPLPAYGPFSVSLPVVNDPARHVQWGFQVKGVCVWVTELGPFGSATACPGGATPTRTNTWGALKALYR